MGRPVDLPYGVEVTVAPGQHAPIAGTHRVVWWDPYVLELTRRAPGGVTQQDLLRADGEDTRGAEGLAEYEAFRAQRAATRELGARPSFVSHTMTGLAAEPNDRASTAPRTVTLEVIDSGATREGRPSGTRFGVLVHALFEQAALADVTLGQAALRGVARFVGRSIGASEEEQAHAVLAVERALGHPLFARIAAAERRGELFREAPVTVCSAAGELHEGSVDLAFREATAAGSQIVVVDFKTDVELGDLTVYRNQLGLYADALERALAEPVTCVLFRV